MLMQHSMLPQQPLVAAKATAEVAASANAAAILMNVDFIEDSVIDGCWAVQNNQPLSVRRCPDILTTVRQIHFALALDVVALPNGRDLLRSLGRERRHRRQTAHVGTLRRRAIVARAAHVRLCRRVRIRGHRKRKQQGKKKSHLASVCFFSDFGLGQAETKKACAQCGKPLS
jgi:hypothetical protein